MLRKAVLLLLVATAPAAAQVQSRPTDPPSVTAANETWYQLREPIPFAGDLYYRAGAVVFFDGNRMVRSGYYNGVPLYTDTTLEPFSVVLVPVRRGLLQPYERLRRGDMAGTTASRTPSFPVQTTPQSPYLAQAPAPPTQLPLPIEEIAAPRPAAASGVIPAPEPAGTGGAQVPSAAGDSGPQEPMATALRPEGNTGVWIFFDGARWRSSGAAVPLRAAEFRVIGKYAGFPVFARANEEGTIYLPTRAGLVAPYKSRW